MRNTIRLVMVVPLLLALAVPLGAQTRDGVTGEFLRDVEQVEKKVVGLARAMPESAFDWRPAKGVRSTAETLMHIAADNYFIPAAMGMPAPAETGVTKEYETAAAFEKKPMSRDAVIAEVGKSFAFLKASLTSVPEEKMGAPLDFFGRKSTHRSAWLLTVTHLHEHLGQLIAYARSNNVTPPWSK
jgi:uncharacterized damage-inducible protein DinB